MSEDVMIRQMKEDDLAAVAELEQRCFSVPWSKSLLKDCLDNAIDRAWVLEITVPLENSQETCKKTVGYCNFRVIAGEGELMRIAVFPEYRKRGFARDLMEVLAADARLSQVQAVTLEVRTSNLSAINLYKSCGFKIEAVRRHYYTNPVEDAIIMWNRQV